ncbi:DUF4097 family beta strand repeat-containing protein [Thalassotalea fusca]
MNKSLSLAGALLLTFGGASNALADVTDRIEKTMQVDAGSELRVENINGEVSIKAWDKDEINVVAIVTADNDNARERVKVIIEQSGNNVLVRTKYKEESNWRNNRNNNVEVEYEIMVPTDTELAGIELVNGSLQVDNVEGNLNVDLVNGSVEVEGAKGDSDISSVNGSIKVVYQSDATSLRDIDIETVNGSVKLALPESIGANVDVDTMHGRIKNDFGLRVEEGTFVGNELKGVIGDGRVDIEIESVNGSVKILKI